MQLVLPHKLYPPKSPKAVVQAVCPSTPPPPKNIIFTLPISVEHLGVANRAPHCSMLPRLFHFAMPRYSAAHLPFPKRAFTIQMKDQSVLRLSCWRMWRPREGMPIHSWVPDLQSFAHILAPPARSVQDHMAASLRSQCKL
jgi:hypothetical protein